MAFTVLALMNAGGIFGRVAPAVLSDKIGRFNLLAPASFIAGLLILVSWMFAHNLATLIVFSVLYGFFSGAFISVVTPCVAQISDIREIGSRIGLMYSILSFPYVSIRILVARWKAVNILGVVCEGDSSDRSDYCTIFGVFFLLTNLFI